MTVLERLEELARPFALAGFMACAEVIAPPNELGAPTAEDAAMLARAEAWWRIMPAQSRRLMLALYTGMELGAPLLAGKLRRFSKLPLEARLGLLEGWRTSKLWPFRFVAEAAKSPVVMMYLAHPSALTWLGATTCEHDFPPRAHLPRRSPFVIKARAS